MAHPTYYTTIYPDESFHTKVNHAWPIQHIIPLYTIQIIPIHTIPYHTIPYHTIPYHTIPYHTIPYHTIQQYTNINTYTPKIYYIGNFTINAKSFTFKTKY
jgi:hypothetical protein